MKPSDGTKYPVMLVHGMGVKDRKHLNAWGRIPQKLMEAGFSIFYGGQDANGTVEDNALAIKKRILEVLALTGSLKVNIIAHSKGGLDARYMISQLDMADHVASLTTISTPHHGSKTMDTLLKIPAFLLRFGCWVTDGFMKIAGDQRPQTYAVIQSFSTEQAELFNRRTPDASQVYYQSYGFYMRHWYSDILMTLPYLVVYWIEGANDGLVAPSSTVWGTYKGTFSGNTNRGISHCDEVDMRRFRFTSQKGGQISDMTQFYLDVAYGLKELGL